MDNIHYLQMHILRELLFKPGAKFSELNIGGLSSDHFSYHVGTLVKAGYVSKESSGYSLTKKGKEFANRMDTESAKLEKQPKVGVMIITEKKVKGRIFLLIQTRLKEPYYGFKGFITGKVRFGDRIIDTARRELLEEAGLTADFKIRYMLHEHVHSQEGDLLEDKIFHVMSATNPQGSIKNTKEGKNEWMTEQQFLSLDEIYYDEADILEAYKDPPGFYVEREYVIDKF